MINSQMPENVSSATPGPSPQNGGLPPAEDPERIRPEAMTPSPVKTPRPVLLLFVGAGAVGAVTLLGAVGSVVWLGVAGRAGPRDVELLAGLVVTGMTGAGLLAAGAGLAWGLRQVLGGLEAIEQRTAALGEQLAHRDVRPQGPPAEPLPADEHRRMLLELQELLLLPEDQRAERYRRHVDREWAACQRAVDEHLQAKRFRHAREELERLAARFGPLPRLAEVERRVAEAAEQARAEQLEYVTAKVRDLVSVTRWEEAERAAEELLDKYPGMPDARLLLENVRRERRLFGQRHRQRMHEEIQQFVSQRRWREAAGAAQRFLETFPQGADADALRQQLDTLNANAEIEIRQQLERHIKEYVQRGEYWDALGLARRIIAEYPFSPQANALRGQLGRLEELARQQGTRR